MNMKILIMSITAGQGHHATAQALCDYFRSRGAECNTLDTYEHVAPLLKELVARGYLLSTARTPGAYSRIYRLAERKTNPSPKLSLTHLINSTLTNEVQDYIIEYNPDIIICTHVFASCIVNILKQRRMTDALTVNIITDFTVHPFWEEVTELDYFVTPSELLEYSLSKKGIPKDKLLPLGIPIQPKFANKMDKKAAREALGLNPDLRTILIMSGSMGYGKIDRTIEKLDQLNLDFQAIVVCGNNEKMRRRLSSLATKKHFQIHGFVNNVDVMMDASDCIVTKPGGLTSSEALAKELPMIMVDPIPGQEARNVEFMLNNGVALYATETFPLDEAIFTLFCRPERVEGIRKAIATIGKKNSTRDICEFILKKAGERNKSLPV